MIDLHRWLTVQVTARYAHLDDANLSAAILKLGDVMEKMTV